MARYEWVIRGACSKLDDVPKGASIESVNARMVLDHCEGCGKLILDGDASYSDDEGVTLCPKCFKELQEAPDA